VRAAAVNYTKHDNNNTITTITQRRKQREGKKTVSANMKTKTAYNTKITQK